MFDVSLTNPEESPEPQPVQVYSGYSRSHQIVALLLPLSPEFFLKIHSVQGHCGTSAADIRAVIVMAVLHTRKHESRSGPSSTY